MEQEEKKENVEKPQKKSLFKKFKNLPLPKKILVCLLLFVSSLILIRAIERTIVNFKGQQRFQENFQKNFLDTWGRPDGQVQNNTQQAQRGSGVGRCSTIEKLIEQAERDVPSWFDVECSTEGIERLPIPTFAKRVVADPNGVFNTIDNLGGLYVALWDKLYKEYSVNISSAVGHVLPPYADENRIRLTYPLSVKDHERVIRGRAIYFLGEKKKGRVIFFSHNPPPGKVAPKFKSIEEFNRWKKDVLLPQKALEAKTAELIKAEYYDPFLVEAEVFFNKIDQPFLVSLPEKELLHVVQNYVDDIQKTVRPLYKGILVGRSYANYDFHGDFFKNVSFKGYDEIMFTLAPQCDLVSTRSYLQKQLANYVLMAKRDNLPWSIGEFDILEQHFNCSNNFDMIEESLYKEMFNQLDAQNPKPIGVHITLMVNRISKSHQAEKIQKVINEYFSKH